MRGPWIAGGNPRHSVRGASVVTCQDVTSQSPGCGIQQGERGVSRAGISLSLSISICVRNVGSVLGKGKAVISFGNTRVWPLSF